MTPQKILIDTFHLAKESTGIRTYTIELCKAVEEFPLEDVRFGFSTQWKKTNKSMFFRGNISLARKMLHHLVYFLWKQLILPLKVLIGGYDVLISPDYVSPKFRLRKCLHLVVMHDAFFWEHQQDYNSLWRKYFTRMIESGAKRPNTRVVTDSHHSRKKLEKFVGLQNISVVYPSVKQSGVIPTSDLSHFQLGSKEYLLHVGYFDKRKNLQALVHAFKRLTDYAGDEYLKLVLVGSPASSPNLNDFDEVTALVSNLNLNERVVLPGFVSMEDLRGLYQQASFYVFPSLDEGFGLPAIEAMMSEIPVVVSNRGSLPEVVNSAALVFDVEKEGDLFDKMLMFYESHELRSEYIAKGKVRSQFFSRASFFEQMLSMTRKG